MMQTQSELLRLSAANLLFPASLSPSPFPRAASLCSAHRAWVAQLSQQLATEAAISVPAPVEGPTELPSSILPASDPTTLQIAASILLTAAFTVFLFRSLRRRAKRAKQTRFRSTGVKKSVKDEALDSLKKASNSAIKRKSRHSADEVFLGAVIAAAFGLMLYKFTTTVEYNLNSQPLPNNFSVRQLTMTIRSIINGLCYLATFIFGFNSVGLFLYSGQLALNSIVDVSTSTDRQLPLNSSSHPKLPDSNTAGEPDDRSSDDTQK